MSTSIMILLLKLGNLRLIVHIITAQCKPQLLLQKTLDINYQNKNGETAVFIASAEGNLSILNSLLERGANVSLAEQDGYTPLYIAVFAGHLQVVEALLQAGADPTLLSPEGKSLTAIAIENNYPEIDKLLKRTIDLDAKIERNLINLKRSSQFFQPEAPRKEEGNEENEQNKLK